MHRSKTYRVFHKKCVIFFLTRELRNSIQTLTTERSAVEIEGRIDTMAVKKAAKKAVKKAAKKAPAKKKK